MAHDPASDDRHQFVTLIQQCWLELQAARKDPVKYKSLAERIRQETDMLRQNVAKAES